MTEVTVWDYNYDLSLATFTDPAGDPVDFEVLSSGSGYWGHSFTKFLVHAKIPAFGWTTVILKLKESASLPASTASGGWCDYIEDRPFVLENSRIRAVFDPLSFAMTSLTDKTTGEEIVTPDKPSAVFRFIRENPRHGMTAWRVGEYMSVDVLNEAGKCIRLRDYGVTGLRRRLSYEIRFASSKLNVTVELIGESKILNFHTDVDWHEIGVPGDNTPQLNFYLPVAYAVKDYTYDIPMGKITRGDIAHDVPGNSFMRLEKDGEAAFIVTDTKYGFRGHENAGAVTLIRSSVDPDPYPERGIHHFNLGVGVCAEADQKRLATLYVHPIAFNAATKHTGTLPMTGAFLTLDAGCGVMVSGVKNGEDGGLIVRVADYGGEGGDVTLILSDKAKTPTHAALVDITERHEIGPCELDGHKVRFTLAPFTMATVKIQ